MMGFTPPRIAALVATSAAMTVVGWFGFDALSGLGAILTTTVGAAAGANLALVGFDVSRVRALHRAVSERAAAGVAPVSSG